MDQTEEENENPPKINITESHEINQTETEGGENISISSEKINEIIESGGACSQDVEFSSSENNVEVLNSIDVDTENDCEYVSEVMYEGSGGQDCENRIFARVSEDGNWLLRWDVKNQKQDDFVALCYQG
ncbi:hypothetical protein HHI36_007546 [Cryptolaemus montrouzieri]|uniref:Uncharacterized protein n=1 Tax=Cryptolaemus montrouzieri TaxID=559131 RepID=A0ABD2MPV5_9CUCU